VQSFRLKEQPLSVWQKAYYYMNVLVVIWNMKKAGKTAEKQMPETAEWLKHW